MRALIGAGVLLAAVGLAAADDKKGQTFDPAKLVGKWAPKEPKKGEEFVMEFAKDGKLSVAGTLDGKAQTFAGTYRLDGDKLAFELKVKDETVKETITLLKLTDDEMEGKDKDGKVEALKRVRAKP